MTSSTIAQHIAAIRQDIQRISAKQVTIVAVSKQQPSAKIELAYDAGIRHFAENRVQEASQKWPRLKQKYPDITLHLIGALQRNKVKQALELFDVVETIDRTVLIDEIMAVHKKYQLPIPQCYMQINCGKEAQKTGFIEEELSPSLAYCQQQGLAISGVMAIPPQQQDPLPHFHHMVAIARQYQLPHVSIGMSSDYKLALQAGATAIRVGTVLFGPRELGPLT